MGIPAMADVASVTGGVQTIPTDIALGTGANQPPATTAQTTVFGCVLI